MSLVVRNGNELDVVGCVIIIKRQDCGSRRCGILKLFRGIRNVGMLFGQLISVEWLPNAR